MNAEPDTGFDAAQAFSLLGDETRVAILEALAASSDAPKTFAQLREAVGVEDSGRFNYHLGKLVGRFVEKTEDGYQLTFAGSRVVGAVYEGTYAEGDTIEPITLDADCMECGASLELAYADERVTVECSECENVDAAFGFPPGAIAGREPEELPAVLNSHTVTMLEQLRSDFCTNCSGPVSPSIDAADEEVTVQFSCDRCYTTARTSVASLLLTEPAVVSFHYDHGIDIRETLLGTLGWLVDNDTEQVSESPPRYAVTGTLDDERLRVVVDDTLEVVETERGSV